MNQRGQGPAGLEDSVGPTAELTIFAGRFGSGKTEAALNYALALAQGWRPGSMQPPDCLEPDTIPEPAVSPILIDLDIVTPYFRSREMAEAMAKRGVRVIAPSIIGEQLDTPAITPQILGAIQQVGRPVVMDVGGDRQGARALAQYRAAIRGRGDTGRGYARPSYVMHFVVNPYRPFTATQEGLARSIAEIEDSSNLRVTSLVSNPNLMGETTVDRIVSGHRTIEAFARELDLPIAFVCIDSRLWCPASNHKGEPGGTRGSDPGATGADLQESFRSFSFASPILPLDRYFVPPWEEMQQEDMQREDGRRGVRGLGPAEKRGGESRGGA
jgi:hypothetical protein